LQLDILPGSGGGAFSGMVASGRIFLAVLTVFGSLGFSTQVRAGGLLAPAEQNRLFVQLETRPMVFYVAKGPADSCGRGCDRWIAAEGTFVAGTAQRFQGFLETLSRQEPSQNLPIAFHSRGGEISQATQIGLILRKRGMKASVGRTTTERCRVFSTKDETCQRLVSSGGDVQARLSPRAGQCHSACVFALAGASTRHVPPGAILGVHSTRLESRHQKQQTQDAPNVRPYGLPEAHRSVQTFLSLMGVDPRVQDIAAKVDSRRLYVLSRDEIARFGIETNGSYETPWLPFQLTDTSIGLLKSLSSQSSSDLAGYVSAAIHLKCGGAFGLHLTYLRILPDNFRHRPTVTLVLAGSSMSAVFGAEQKGIAGWGIAAPFHVLEQAAEKSTIDVIETYVPSANRNSQTVNVSTDGLPKALTSLKKLCSGR
jgi:hypothetical protein